MSKFQAAFCNQLQYVNWVVSCSLSQPSSFVHSWLTKQFCAVSDNQAVLCSLRQPSSLMQSRLTKQFCAVSVNQAVLCSLSQLNSFAQAHSTNSFVPSHSAKQFCTGSRNIFCTSVQPQSRQQFCVISSRIHTQNGGHGELMPLKMGWIANCKDWYLLIHNS